MKLKLSSVFVITAFALVLTGCQTTFVVHNAKVGTIISAFKDYAGTHGYALTYANDKTGSYHIDMGNVFVPYTSSTTKTKTSFSSNPPAGSNQPMTGYEQTTWNTVANPDHYEEATAAINITQKDTDVYIFINTNDVGGASLNDVKDYLQSLGYTVDNK